MDLVTSFLNFLFFIRLSSSCHKTTKVNQPAVGAMRTAGRANITAVEEQQMVCSAHNGIGDVALQSQLYT